MFKPFEILKRFCSCYGEAAEIDEKENKKIDAGAVALASMHVSEDAVSGEMEQRGNLLAREAERRGLAPDKKHLLPLKRDRRPTLVLDLDQTLVHSTFEMPRCYDFSIRLPGCCAIFVKLRPHIVSFIESVGRRYEIVVFTAAKKEYAGRVIEEIDRTGCIAHVLCRDSCTLFDGKYIKDLSRLGRPLNSVVLVDDIPYSYKLQPQNGIHIPPYTGEEGDDALQELMLFLCGLSPEEDISGHVVRAPFKADVVG